MDVMGQGTPGRIFDNKLQSPDHKMWSDTMLPKAEFWKLGDKEKMEAARAESKEAEKKE